MVGSFESQDIQSHLKPFAALCWVWYWSDAMGCSLGAFHPPPSVPRPRPFASDSLALPVRRQVSEMMLKKYLGEAQQHTFMTLVQVGLSVARTLARWPRPKDVNLTQAFGFLPSVVGQVPSLRPFFFFQGVN